MPSFVTMASYTTTSSVRYNDGESLQEPRVHKLWSNLCPFDQASLCQALEEDAGLSRFLRRILDSDIPEARMLGLQGDAIKRFMDLMNSSLGYDVTLHRKAYRLLLGILHACDIIPSPLFLSRVELLEVDAVSHGGFADIFKGTKDGREVALKRPRRYIGHDHSKVQHALIRQALVWQDLHHPNILLLLGIDIHTFSSNSCIVSPWMQRGTILQHIQDSNPSTTEIDKLLLEVAQGLAYLHRNNIVHGNLSGANILIDQDSHARLSGFSLAGLADAEAFDFELAAWTIKVTTKDGFDASQGSEELALRTPASDVYTFGCLCLEIYTVHYVHDVNNNRDGAENHRLFRGQARQPSIVDMQISRDLWDLIQSCWQPDPARPSMEDVLDRMKEFGFGMP